MNGNKLSKFNHERLILRVTINNDFKPRKHCSDVAKKSNKMVSFMGRTFQYILSNLDLTDPNLTDFGFNGLCLLADNQPRSGLKSISVKESTVGGDRVGNIIR